MKVKGAPLPSAKFLDTFVAVDVETTGLDFETECIIELAGVRFEHGEEVARFEVFLPPTKSLTAVSSLLTGLREEELCKAPPPVESLQAFLDFAGELPLVAHNAEFDSTFLRNALKREGLPQPVGPWLDSLLLARAAWPTWESHRLDSLSERLGILRDVEHRALPDARRAGLVFLAGQRVLHASVSPDTWNTLAGVASDLPGWSRVFCGTIGATPVILENPEILETPAEFFKEDASIGDAAQALADRQWLVWETAPQKDELRLALNTALKTASKGLRVMLCVPDASARDAVGKKLWSAMHADHATLRLSTLGEPGNYLCRRRLRDVLNNPAQRLSLEERVHALPLAVWADQTLSSFIGDCRGFSPERARLLWSRVCCDAYDDDPGAREARATAGSAHIVLITHSALCAHLKLEGALLPACDTLVVSGAHQLPDTARKLFGREVTLFRLRAILKMLKHVPEKNQPETEIDSWFELEKQLQRFFQKAGKQAVKRRSPGETRLRYTESFALAFGANPEPIIAAFKEQEELLKDSDPEINRVLSRLRSFRFDFERLCEARYSENVEEVYWLEDFSNPHKAALRSMPVALDADLGVKLRTLFDGGLFLSQSITVAGPAQADFFLRSIGMLDAESTSASEAKVRVLKGSDPHPLPFFMAPSFPANASVESAAEFAKFLCEAGQPFSASGIFVFFPTPGALKGVHQTLRALLPSEVPLWAQHVDGGKDALYKLFASTRGGWILATEGVENLCDMQGRSPALAIIARMPMPSSREPLLEMQSECLRDSEKNRGKNLRHELWHPMAVLRLKREFALLRRKPGLKAVWLLDARAAAEGLGAFAARSLGCEPQTAADLAALQALTQAALG